MQTGISIYNEYCLTSESAKNSVTTLIPFRLMNERESSIAVDILHDLPSTQQVTSHAEYVNKLKSSLLSAFNIARVQNAQAGTRQKDRYDHITRAPTLYNSTWRLCDSITLVTHGKLGVVLERVLNAPLCRASYKRNRIRSLGSL